MSVETIRVALGRLQVDPDDEVAWNQLTEAVTAPGATDPEIERLLDRARGKHEQRREWAAVARLLELELALEVGTPVEGDMQAELARIYHEELASADRAEAAYKRLLEIRPDDEKARGVLEQHAAKRDKWRDLVARYEAEAQGAGDDAFKSSLHTSAADAAFRYGGEAAASIVREHLEAALKLDPKNRRAAGLAEIAFSSAGAWDDVARVQKMAFDHAPAKEERVAAGLRLGRTCALRLKDTERAVDAYGQVLDLAPGQPDALRYLAETFSAREDWDHLAALYEDQLRGGSLAPAEELGILVQIAMVHWRMRGQPASAEPYFDRVRRQDPTHAGMLAFFRETCTAKNDKARLSQILAEAQRAMPDGPDKRALAAEIAKLAESQENVQKAIEQYKALLRAEPDNREVRDALKRLYTQAESWNALVELHRQELERTPASDAPARVAILREIAAIYRERVKSDAALVTVLTQIVQLDARDIEALRELACVYETLGRWRDLLACQQKLAELSTGHAEKVNLYRAVARRWLEQFSNVQNAVAAYEALLGLEPNDVEAQQKLRELYQKRRAWPQLYALYEKQLEAAEGPARAELLVEMARLAAERLGRGADAIALLKRVLETDASARGVLDQLEKQAEHDKDWQTVAEVLERRVDLASDDAGRLAALQKLGDVYAQRLKDPAQAAKAWRRVLAISPGHARALRVLRESYVAAGDWEGLERLYGSQGDWEGLVDFLSTVADKAQDPKIKLDVSFRAARIYEEQLQAPERATRSYERVLSVSPRDERAASALAPIYEKEEKWARLPALYEILLGATEDPGAKVALLRKLATVTGGPLADKAAALRWARKAYELDPSDESLASLESWARAAGQWTPFVEALDAHLKSGAEIPVERARALRLKVAEVYGRELGRIDESVAAYRELVEADPDDASAVATLDGILRANQRRDDLRWLFQLRVGRASGDEQAEILEEWASLEEQVFGDAKAAIALLRRVTSASPRRSSALRSLAHLLVASGEHAAAAEVLVSYRDASEGAERARREIELAGLYLDPLARAEDAFEACTRALELAPHDEAAVALLERLVEVPATRARAAAVLEREYAASGDGRREAQAIRVRLEGERDASERRALRLRLADVEEAKLGAPGAAFDVLLSAIAEMPEDLSLWERAGELAQKAGRPADLAAAFRERLAAASALPEDVIVDLCQRAATLHDEQLGDADGAKPYLERVLAIEPTNARAFARLKQILVGGERWAELEAVYDRAAEATSDPKAHIDLLADAAIVADEMMGDPDKAIRYCEAILGIDPGHEATLDSLEKLYERRERWSDLARLLEKRLEAGTAAAPRDVKLALGRLYAGELATPERALAHLEDVLGAGDDADARRLVEKLLDVPALRQRAARVLEGAYKAKDDVRDLVRVLEIRLEAAADDAERRELLRRIATLRDERLKDDAGAFEALSALVAIDPEGEAERTRFVEIGRRLGRHEKVAEVLEAAAGACARPHLAGEILMEVARISEDLLADPARAQRVYRRVIAQDPGDASLVLPAAEALARILAANGDHEALADVLAIQVRLEVDAGARRALHERIGTLYENVLNEPAKAIAAWQACLGDDPADEEALAALERLFERTEQWTELVSVLRAREQAASEEAERRRTMERAARVIAEKIGDLPEAILAWRSVLDAFGPERPTLAALEGLYEKAERWADLAETLEVDLSLAEEVEAKLDLYVRLGDVRRERQEDLAGALEAYKQALILDPGHAGARRALEAMLDLPDARREAAETLHPLYEADGDAERLLRVLEIEVETTELPSERLATLQTALRTAEGPLSDAKRALAYAVRAVREAVGESEIGTWIETAERLTEATGRWAELCALYQEVAPGILDGEAQQNVRLRIGELAKDKLGDRDLAIASYRKALDARGDDRRAMIALEALYEAANDPASLLGVLRLRAEGADDAEKKELFYRIADLQKGPLADKPGAIETYEALIDIALEPRAAEALEALYLEAGRHGDRVALYERQIDAGLGAPADVRVKIATAAIEHTADVPRAFDELEAALAADPGHAGAVALLEKLLASSEPEHAARAGEMLEPVYLRRAAWKDVERAIKARLATCQDPGERKELLTRLATLHEEQLEDYTAALETVALLLHDDLSDENVWRELSRLAKVAGAERRLAAIYAKELDALEGDDPSSAKLCRRTGELFADFGETESALKWFRRAHAFEPESRELFETIDKLLVAESRHAERAELYRAALDWLTGTERSEALHTIARIERGELRQPERAVETYRAALEVDERDEKALEALTELYRELGSDRDLADLYLRRAEMAEGGEAAAPFRLALARLLKDKLDETAGAINQLEAIVTDVPWHEEAIRELETLTKDEANKARVIDILRPLYERSDDWRRMVRINEEELGVADDPSRRVELYRENARLLETRGGDRERALVALRAAFDTDPEDGDTRAELERVAEALGAWEALAESFERALAGGISDVVRRELLVALARHYDKALDDPRRALGTLQRLAELDPSDPEPLEAIDTLSVLLGDWPALVAVLEKKASLTSDEDAAALFRRVADVKLMLEDPAGAIEAYERALDLDPHGVASLDALIELYEPKGDEAAQRLVELYARRVELAGDDADLRYDLNLRAAERWEGALADRREAIAALGAALDARPGDPKVLGALERLYREEAMWSELLDNLKLQASIADDKAARVKLRKAIGELYAGHLESPAEALEQYRLVLDDDAADEEARLAVLRIGERFEDLRAETADVLEPVLRAAGRHEELVKVLEMRLASQTDPAERARTLRTIAVVSDVELGRPEAAQAALVRALEDVPDDAALYDEIERLAERANGFASYADALDERAGALFDAVVAKDLYVRLGRIAEERLKDDARAVSAYARAVERAGDQPELLEALDRLYARLGDTKALADVLERRVGATTDERAQADLLHRLATIQIEAFGAKAQGLSTLRQALERSPDHEAACKALEGLTDVPELFDDAAEALENVYRMRGDAASLARLYEKRVSYAPTAADRVRMRIDLARVLEERQNDPDAAQRTLENALADDPTDPDVLAEIERLAAITTKWQAAAEAFEKAILAREDLAGDTACDLWVRLAGWRRDKLGDGGAAERAFEHALRYDATNESILRSIESIQREPGRERDLVRTLRRLAALELPSRASELRREAKVVAETTLGDKALAEAILREMLEADDGDLWALAELTKLREEAGDHAEAFALLTKQASLAAEASEIRELRHRAAAVARDRLGDEARAVELYEAIVEDEPHDEKASEALRALLTKAGEHRKLYELLERLVDLAETKAARSALRLEAAVLCINHLDAPADAAELLRAILDEEPIHEQATLLLSQVLEKTGRDEELAALLSSRIELARERGDVPGELAYRVRLGEVYESRLGDVPKAIETYEAVLERDPGHAAALGALARLYERKGDRAEAARILEKVLGAASGAAAVETALRLAGLYAALKDREGERRVLERALAVDGRAVEVRERLRKLYEQQAAWAALGDLVAGDASLAATPAEQVALYRKAAEIHQSRRNDPARAAELLERASELAPGDRDLLLALCDAYSASGRGKQAAAALQKIVESYGTRRTKDLAGILHRLAKAYAAEGEKEKALAELEAAFKVDPGSVGVLRDLGVLALELAGTAADDKARAGYLDRAQRMFRALLLQKLEGGAPITKAEVFYYLAEVSHRQGDDKKAIQSLERALDNDKNLAPAIELMARLKK